MYALPQGFPVLWSRDWVAFNPIPFVEILEYHYFSWRPVTSTSI